jgi:hypothetical protein
MKITSLFRDRIIAALALVLLATLLCSCGTAYRMDRRDDRQDNRDDRRDDRWDRRTGYY